MQGGWTPLRPAADSDRRDSDYGHAAVVDLQLAAKADVHAGGVCGRQHARARVLTRTAHAAAHARARARGCSAPSLDARAAGSPQAAYP